MDHLAATTPNESPPGQNSDVLALVAGIIRDFQSLMTQQFRLTRLEITDNLQLRKSAAVYLALAASIGMLSAFAGTLAAVHLLHWSLSPSGSDPGWMPLGVCYAVIGFGLLGLSLGLWQLGRTKFQAIPPWQDLADDIFEEPQPWMKNPQ